MEVATVLVAQSKQRMSGMLYYWARICGSRAARFEPTSSAPWQGPRQLWIVRHRSPTVGILYEKEVTLVHSGVNAALD